MSDTLKQTIYAEHIDKFYIFFGYDAEEIAYLLSDNQEYTLTDMMYNRYIYKIPEQDKEKYKLLTKDESISTEIIYEEPIDKALRLIGEYRKREFEDEKNDLHSTDVDLGNISLAYTNHEETDAPIEVSVDLINYTITQLYDGMIVKTDKYDSLSQLNQELENLDFQDLTIVEKSDLINAMVTKLQNNEHINLYIVDAMYDDDSEIVYDLNKSLNKHGLEVEYIEYKNEHFYGTYVFNIKATVKLSNNGKNININKKLNQLIIDYDLTINAHDL